MTFYVDNETEYKLSEKLQGQMKQVIQAVVEMEGFTYPFELSLLITDNQGIKKYNSSYRCIEKETDVLSFPNLDFTIPASYEFLDETIGSMNYYNPDSGQVILGDVIISYEKIVSQAKEYGHSETRELCFLIAHSMLHLLGYDHMEAEEATVMEAKQDQVLNKLGITKDIN